ncbi:hypothetical protein FOMPIDRAFT_1027536 [Fomitopsis schrenkii]|uniref:NAD-binding protein n=1 Tax=Fomitopsis schrenkii TaxID=2126942 RepID=S8G576_FOMSC|nr:hypothetical protein FOMPIDRAFT_1027536 [Fomitopsis schrenkii]
MARTPRRRVSLVAGAARGIGRSIALRLAKDGLDIAQLTCVVSEMEDITGRRALAIPGKVACEEDVQAMTEVAMESRRALTWCAWALERPSICSVEERDRTLAVNLRGMIRQGRAGLIIGLSGSVSSYTASKIVVRGLTQFSATEVVKHKITPTGLPARAPPRGDPAAVASLVSYYLASPAGSLLHLR